MADPTIPTFSEQLWSEECGIAGIPDTDPPGYTFSNGRSFAAPKYDNTTQPIPNP